MPDDSGGSFDGGGSVRWEVVTTEEDNGQSNSEPNFPNGRKDKGADKKHDKYFRIFLKAPDRGPERTAFLAQFSASVPIVDGVVELKLLIDKDQNRQVQVLWDDAVKPKH